MVIHFRCLCFWARLFTSFLKKLINKFFHKQRFFERNFPKNFYTRNKIFHNQRFFHEQGSFRKWEIFAWSWKFSTIKKIFHKQIFFYNQRSFPWSRKFPQTMVFSLSRIFFARKFKTLGKSFNTLIPGGNKISYVLTQTRIYRFV